ncbi:hypothetical protein MACJ_003926 [Theileria orientalis]|uniref:Uncharacterized protein n=1 Tax=Theileria orientalis TaxID=68886 RepID=A0A976SKU4_THEOR|nr:hypothetical protein MACJ_003926 [Theileria orientalis]
MSAHLSRLVTFLAQLLLDFVFRDNPLPKVRLQFLLCSTLNAIAVGCLFYYHDTSPCEASNRPEKPKSEEKPSEVSTTTESSNNGATNGGNGKKEPSKWSFGETFSRVASPFFMYSAGSTLFDTVHPGVIPYALLPTKKCHLINMMSPIANLTGPLVLFALETAGALANSFMDPLSFSGVAKILFVPKNHIPDLGVLLLHELFCMVVRYFNDKLSVGYNVVRTSLGKAIRDARSDLKLDVKKYL